MMKGISLSRKYTEKAMFKTVDVLCGRVKWRFSLVSVKENFFVFCIADAIQQQVRNLDFIDYVQKF